MLYAGAFFIYFYLIWYNIIMNKLIKKIEAAGLLGRGCGIFPTAKKWQIVADAPGKEKYVICNCSESEPGIFKDEFILDNYSELVLDGLRLAMQTLNARQGFIYLNPLYYSRFHHKLQILAGHDNIEIFSKPVNDYIGGEESTIVNLMEGKREEPRFKPPFVLEKGFLNKPTLVNNCETFYDVALISQGKYRQERFFCISGDNTPKNIFKSPETITVKQALLESGHYPNFKFFIQLGGAMAGICLAADQLDDYTIQSYSGLIIHELAKDERQLVNQWLEFYKKESCGQCVPCREGTYRLHEMYNAKDFDSQLFADIIFSMQNSSLCSLGKMATTAITSYFENIKKRQM
ncbi:hypothetical protein AUK13_01330 [Candidatus Kuenenbacteria bacterium CG2_30_39_24]|uniref:NADH-ubiquinone oxidoreductase 51kDa subunit iron-sulphur binding domain-containing protein n=1 Tax=Candidatus Kuenenbacteria bacterium CG2_30_39_24 TaxID=1805236 RepID=A0A1J5F842_9BACT|nr:MAG: hypothetical protein AUK13_01330 [Candidatus Kuenenbacteria bacterium CG2_30_39_24]